MSTASLTLTGTQTGEWDTTPPTGDSDHHTLVNEAYPPGDDGNYVQVNGHVASLVDAFRLSAGPADINLVTAIRLQLFGEGSIITNIPAFRVEIWVSDAKMGEASFSFDSGGSSEATTIEIPVHILGSDWINSVRYVKFIPIDGNAGYTKFPYFP